MAKLSQWKAIPVTIGDCMKCTAMSGNGVPTSMMNLYMAPIAFFGVGAGVMNQEAWWRQPEEEVTLFRSKSMISGSGLQLAHNLNQVIRIITTEVTWSQTRSKFFEYGGLACGIRWSGRPEAGSENSAISLLTFFLKESQARCRRHPSWKESIRNESW